MIRASFPLLASFVIALPACGADPGGNGATGHDLDKNLPGDAAVDAGAHDAEAGDDAPIDPPEAAPAQEPLEIAPLHNDPAPLATPTYDGSGQAVEPTVLEFPGLWRGHRYWMAVSPYPGANDQLENPSILVSYDGLTWRVPEGLENPLALPPQGGHLDDATIVYDDTSDELWLYYLQDLKTDGVNQETILRIRSRDGVHWGSKEVVLTHPDYPFVSPTVVKHDGVFTMWTVEATAQGCFSARTIITERTSTDGAAWSSPREVSTGLDAVPWHLNTIAAPTVPGGFLSVVSAYPHGATCQSTELYLSAGTPTSWRSSQKPLLGHGAGGRWDASEIYRSSLLYEADSSLLRVWYSARPSSSQEWHVGYAQGVLRFLDPKP
jgi:hypothetical protein